MKKLVKNLPVIFASSSALAKSLIEGKKEENSRTENKENGLVQPWQMFYFSSQLVN